MQRETRRSRRRGQYALGYESDAEHARALSLDELRRAAERCATLAERNHSKGAREAASRYEGGLAAYREEIQRRRAS